MTFHSQYKMAVWSPFFGGGSKKIGGPIFYFLVQKNGGQFFYFGGPKKIGGLIFIFEGQKIVFLA